jgi:hypothetical protein
MRRVSIRFNWYFLGFLSLTLPLQAQAGADENGFQVLKNCNVEKRSPALQEVDEGMAAADKMRGQIRKNLQSQQSVQPQQFCAAAQKSTIGYYQTAKKIAGSLEQTSKAVKALYRDRDGGCYAELMKNAAFYNDQSDSPHAFSGQAVVNLYNQSCGSVVPLPSNISAWVFKDVK